MKFSKYIQFLAESFGDAQRKFSAMADPDEVKEYIDRFKELSQKNIIKDRERDITKWIPQGWETFKSFIDRYKNHQTKKQQKVAIGKDAIKVLDNQDWLVVIPLTKAASCKYGANTKWCTAGEEDNPFDSYFNRDNMVMFYIMNKTTNKKYAVAAHKELEQLECFDEEDNRITEDELQKITGFHRNQYHHWIEQYEDRLDEKRRENPEIYIKQFFERTSNREKAEAAILAVMTVYKEENWTNWAKGWLDGTNTNPNDAYNAASRAREDANRKGGPLIAGTAAERAARAAYYTPENSHAHALGALKNVLVINPNINLKEIFSRAKWNSI